jgi:hypothetical protein
MNREKNKFKNQKDDFAVCKLILFNILILGYFFTISIGANANYSAISLRNPLLSFDITDQGADTASSSSSTLHYKPKVPSIMGIELGTKGFTFGYSKTLTSSQEKEEQKFTDYNIKYYLETMGFDCIYSEFLGFRLISADNLNLTQIPQDEKFRKDFAIKAANLNLYYFPLHLGWSLNRSLDPSQSEQTTGLGLGLVASYNSVGLDTQFGAIPTAFQSTFGQDGTIKRGLFESTSLSLAAAGSLALKPLFLTFMTTTGRGEQTQKYETSSEVKTNKGIATRQSLVGLLGLTTQNFFIALQVLNESPRFILKDLSLIGSHTEVSLKFGLKF